MAGVFEALGERRRRDILQLLAEGEQSAGTVVELLQASVDISQPAVSQHLKVLRDAGLVTTRVEGTRRIYAIDRHGLAQASAWLADLEPGHPFDQQLDALATEVARGQRRHRGGSTNGEQRTA